MGLPNVTIEFKTTAAASIARSQKGTVGLILEDANAAAQGKAYIIRSTADIPKELDTANALYITRALIGYVNPPKSVRVFVLPGDATDLTDGFAYFATVEVDYLCGPHNCTSTEASAIATWVKSRRAEHYIVKAVLPETPADSEGVINVTAEGVVIGSNTLAAAALCSQIAGLIAGTPMTISCTYAPLYEVTDITRLSREDMDAAIDAGKLILYHDGEKVKVARGINSLVTTTQDKGAAFKKIKIVEAVDMIQHDIRRVCEDSYIGKYANSYDNKCLLITAIQGYFSGLETAGILDPGKSSVAIDLTAQANYLEAKGTDTTTMSEQEIKEANTGDKVFITCSVKILDAIEDIAIGVTL